eukprot:CAMPEP_0195518712 /NCGR_PEP_ID=MMETSP0794_2-20130614/13547_1 /TAXON_ID=515487 /ORGANISM="Stephanopyxis turris, Strain CCMP 815" /LENGTH=305 /DNA_ID=CAMNT_0040647733 /DNA_START=153 /DNA_END=1070 /DNA_ORIENTATION=+
MSSRDTQWILRYEELSRYRAEHGDCLVPRNFPPNPKLGRWVNHQRKDYKSMREKKQSPMNLFRVTLLEGLGFAWISLKTGWEERFEELKKFHAQFGHCLVPQQYRPNQQLGRWVNVQRKDYKLMKENKQSPMTQERISLLEDLGFTWTIDTAKKLWKERLDELKMYNAQHGDCLVPYHYERNPQLGRWVNVQRKNYKLFREGKKSAMTQERIDQLEELNFVWDAQKADRAIRIRGEGLHKFSLNECETSSPTFIDPESLKPVQLADFAMDVNEFPCSTLQPLLWGYDPNYLDDELMLIKEFLISK